jgi:Ni/Fe-hydrogenase 1 B-type cytochrome subunit
VSSPAAVPFRPMKSKREEPIYVWDLVVRATHWAIAGAILVLATTGYYIGHPFIVAPAPAEQHFVTGTIRVVHFWAAMAFTVAVLARIIWMFTATTRYARWDQLVPASKKRILEMFETFKFYIFLRPRPPEWPGHNALAGATYVAVFGLYLVMIVTGFAMYGAEAAIGSPFHWTHAFASICGGLARARLLHHVVMWLLLGFVTHHIFSAMLSSGVERNGEIDSIFSGYKHEDLKDG